MKPSFYMPIVTQFELHYLISISLIEEQKMADCDQVLRCWSAVEADYGRLGGEILLCLFREHPHTQLLFPKFATIPLAELEGNPEVEKHGAVVLGKLGEILKAKGDHTSVLKSLATTHVNIHKVSIENFKLLTGTILKVLSEKAVLNADGQAALSNVVDGITAGMEGYYREMGFLG
ncbi:myoglobin-like [Arapaima gigas]